MLGIDIWLNLNISIKYFKITKEWKKQTKMWWKIQI